LETGLFESLVYSESLLKKFKYIEDLEKESEEILSDECRSFLSNFKKEFNSPIVFIDLEKIKDYEVLKEIYLNYKNELKGIWQELWDVTFYKISKKVFKNTRKFGTKFDDFLEVNTGFELLDITSISELLHGEELSSNLFTIFLSFIIFELKKFGLYEKLKEKEKIIARRIVEWNPRLKKMLDVGERKIEESDIVGVKKEMIKFFNEKIKEIKEELEKIDIEVLPEELSREFTRILRYCAVTLKDLKKKEKQKEKKSLFPDNHLYYILNFFTLFEKIHPEFKDVEKDLKLIFAEGFKTFRRDSSPFFDRYIERKMLGVDIKTEEFYSKNVYFIKDVLRKLFELKLIERKILLKPFENPFDSEKKNDHFIYFSLIPRSAFIKLKNMKRVKIRVEVEKKFQDFVRKNRSVISILVYDIRGSTYMSLSLFNAEKELSIKKKFQELMKNIILSYGGFPVKETGDGGIAFFSQNSKELYREIYEESVLSGYKMRFQKALSEHAIIHPDERAGEKALLCALDLLEKSEEFIRRNYPEYRGFFPDVVGTSSPLKSLFRIGVGIYSGKLNKDIYLSFNSYGDFDIQGPASNLAAILSEIRFPDSSSILMEANTFTNILLNSDLFEVEEDIKEHDIKDLLLNIKNFKIKDKKFKVKNIGYLNIEEPNKDNIYRPEEVNKFEFVDDLFLIKGKKGIPVYGGKR